MIKNSKTKLTYILSSFSPPSEGLGGGRAWGGFMKPLLFCSLFLSFNLALSAQTLIPEMEEPVRVEEIREIDVFSLKIPAETDLLALSGVLVSKEELEIPSLFTPADALQRKAGISLTRDGIWATSVNVRGLSKERILILADGDRIQTATDIAAALSAIDQNSLERIEVIKGAASVLYGTGAMGGVVNFVTEHPAYTSGFEVHGRAGTGFNTVNKLSTSDAKVQVSENNWYLSANGSYRKAQDTKVPGGVLDNSQFEDYSFGVQGGMTYDDSQELLVNYQRYEANNVGIPGGPFRPDAKVRYRNIERNLLSGEYIFYDPLSVLNKFSIKAYTQNISRDVENYMEAQSLTILPSSLNTTSGVKLLSDWDLLSPYHRLIVGAEGWQRKAETARYKITETETNKFTVRGEQPVPHAKMLDLGVFAQYSWKIHPRKLTLDAGLRFDYIQTKNDTAYDPVFTSVIQNGKETIDENITRKVLFPAGAAGEFSYAAHVDLVYKPMRRHELVLSLSNAYRAASLEERFKYIDQGVGTLLQVGNPDLKPEQGGFSNLSYQFTGSKFNLKADVFANYLFNLITAQQGIYNGVDALINTNIDEALFLGAEIEATYWLTRHFWATANAGYTRARDTKNDAYLPQIPPLSGFAELNYRLQKALTVSVSAHWATKQREAAEKETQTEGYAVLNAAIRSEKLKLNSVYLQFFAGMDNIFNTAYYNHLRTTRNGYAQEEPGRNIYAKVQIGF